MPRDVKRPSDSPIKAKAVLVDPASMTVVWMNDSAARDYDASESTSATGLPLAEAVPMAGALGLVDAVRIVAGTGVAQHLRTDLVSTYKGSMAIATSVYRLPDGTVLVITENTWHVGQGKKSRADGG